MAPVSTAPAAVMSASCCACDVPFANVTMYGTKGPEGGALVVGAVVVVPLVVVVAADEVEGTVVVAPEDVEAVVVVAPDDVESVVVVAPEDVVDPVPVDVEVEELSVEAAVEVVSLDVELEKVLPIVIGETSPSAPETSSPSANTAATPTNTRICRRRRLRRFTGCPADSLDPDAAKPTPLQPQRAAAAPHPQWFFARRLLADGLVRT